jgi:hypothetical protein
MELCRNNERYQLTEELFQAILRFDTPNVEILKSIFGNKSEVALYHWEQWREKHGEDLKDLTPRKHNAAAPMTIAQSRVAVEEIPAYQSLQKQLLQGIVPSLEEFEPVYNIYAPYVHKAFQHFQIHHLKRKCGIPAITHLNRVGGVIYQMKFDNNSDEGNPAIGALHDVIEDLLDIALDENGNVYKLSRYEEFLNYFIPEHLQEPVMLLTNHYDLIVNSANQRLKKINVALTDKNLLNEVKKIAKSNNKYISSYADRLIESLAGFVIREDVIEEIKWFACRRLYLKELAKKSDEMGNLRLMEIKAIDLSDNGHGKDALPLNSRIKNLIKQERWARRGFELKSPWAPLNARIEEIAEDAYVASEHLIRKDFLAQDSVQDFFVSALNNVRKLKSVFYVRPSKAGAELPKLSS